MLKHLPSTAVPLCGALPGFHDCRLWRAGAQIPGTGATPRAKGKEDDIIVAVFCSQARQVWQLMESVCWANKTRTAFAAH